MNTFTKDLAAQAGFKFFGDRIVAADGNSSGAATKSLEKFVELLIGQVLDITEPMPGSGDIQDIVLKDVQRDIKEKFGIE